MPLMSMCFLQLLASTQPLFRHYSHLMLPLQQHPRLVQHLSLQALFCQMVLPLVGFMLLESLCHNRHQVCQHSHFLCKADR